MSCWLLPPGCCSCEPLADVLGPMPSKKGASLTSSSWQAADWVRLTLEFLGRVRKPGAVTGQGGNWNSFHFNSNINYWYLCWPCWGPLSGRGRGGRSRGRRGAAGGWRRWRWRCERRRRRRREEVEGWGRYRWDQSQPSHHHQPG